MSDVWTGSPRVHTVMQTDVPHALKDVYAWTLCWWRCPLWRVFPTDSPSHISWRKQARWNVRADKHLKAIADGGLRPVRSRAGPLATAFWSRWQRPRLLPKVQSRAVDKCSLRVGKGMGSERGGGFGLGLGSKTHGAVYDFGYDTVGARQISRSSRRPQATAMTSTGITDAVSTSTVHMKPAP